MIRNLNNFIPKEIRDQIHEIRTTKTKISFLLIDIKDQTIIYWKINLNCEHIPFGDPEAISVKDSTPVVMIGNLHYFKLGGGAKVTVKKKRAEKWKRKMVLLWCT